MLNTPQFIKFEQSFETSSNVDSNVDSNESLDDAGENSNEEEYDEEAATDTQNEPGNEYVGPILPGGHRFDKKLVCIRYPGNVINADKAIETLGGLTDISGAVDSKTRRMELRFRPDDAYCNPTCGDRHDTVGFLLRVRVKKSRKEKVEASQHNSNQKLDESDSDKEKIDSSHKDEKQNGVTNQECEIEQESRSHSEQKESNDDIGKNKPPSFDTKKYENLANDTDYSLPKLKVLGRVDSEFRFTSLCDFQYLPITKNKDNPAKDECIYDKIYPVGLPPINWMDNEVPYFLPPPAFSRMDTVQQYVPKPETSSNGAPDIIGKTRKPRRGLSNFISFNSPFTPMNPPKNIETAIKVKLLQTSHVEKMRSLFESRPIWSKVALKYVTNFSNEQLKVLLPSVAYYFITGPWRITWVKLGYDPRKDPESRKYQTLDYRMKGMDGLLSSFNYKKNYSEKVLRNRNVPNVTKHKATVLASNSRLQPEKKSNSMNENAYMYRPGFIPPSRQMFYQYCDVHVKEIEDMLDKYVGPPPGTPCHEKYGWLPSNFDDLCREIISKYVRLELRKLMNIPENHPTRLPPKRKTELSARSLKRMKRKAIQASKKVVVQELPATDMPMYDGVDEQNESEEEEEEVEEEEEEWIDLDGTQPDPSDNDVDN